MTRVISPRTRIGVCPETETTINIYFIPEIITIGGVRTNYDGIGYWQHQYHHIGEYRYRNGQNPPIYGTTKTMKMKKTRTKSVSQGRERETTTQNENG